MKIVRLAIATTFSVLALLFLVGWIGMSVMPISARDLTDQEMARTYGRQPNPIGGGDDPEEGCYLKKVIAKCDEDNPCWCKDGEQNPECSLVSLAYKGFNKIDRHRPRKLNEEANSKKEVIGHKVCADQFLCAAGELVMQKSCDSDGKCLTFGINNCRPCVRDIERFLGHVYIEEHRCED